MLRILLLPFFRRKPTADNSEKEVLENTKKRYVNATMGDYNTKIGKRTEDKIIEGFGLGQRN